jgi:hypothetical protein
LRGKTCIFRAPWAMENHAARAKLWPVRPVTLALYASRHRRSGSDLCRARRTGVVGACIAADPFARRGAWGHVDGTNLVAGVEDRQGQILAMTSAIKYSSPWSLRGSLVSRSSKPRVFASSVIALVLVIDQLSKQWALTALAKVGSTVVLPGPVDLTLVFITATRSVWCLCPESSHAGGSRR